MDKKEWNKMIHLSITNKEKSGFDGMINWSPTDYNNFKMEKYLNISIDLINSCAGMVEWLTQSVANRCPSGLVGSIPTPSAANKFLGDLA